MKLQNVRIKDFKGLENVSLDPEKINVLLGENGKGKTSLLEAIRYLITGEYPENSIRIGKDKCELSAIVNGDSIVCGRKTGKNGEAAIFKLEGKTTSYSSYKKSLTDRGLLNQVTATEFASSSKLMDMDVDALTEFMLANTPVQISLDKLISLAVGITQPMEDELRNILPTENITLNHIAEADAYFTQVRKNIKAACDTAKANAVFVGEIPNENDTLEDLQKIYEKNIGLIASVKAKSDNYRNYLKLVDSRNQILANIKAREEQAESIKCEKPDDTRLGEINKELERNKTTVSDYRTVMISLVKDIELFEKTLENLNSDKCPISDKLICKTDKTAIKGDIAKAIEDNKSSIEKMQNCINVAESNILKLESEKNKLEADKKQYERYIDLLKSVNELKKSVPSLPEKVDEEKTDVSQLEFDNRIIKSKMENIRMYTEFLEKNKKYKALCEKRDTYEALCKLLDEKGILREQILTFALKPFEDYVNDRAKALNVVYRIQIKANKGVRILYNPKGASEFISYNNASAGEKLMISFLILDMINALSDMRVLFLDNLDKLDKQALANLVGVINMPEVLDAYDHIFMVGVDHEDALEELKKLDASCTQIIKF